MKRLFFAILFLFSIAYLVLIWSFSSLILFPKSSIELTKSRIITKWQTTFEDMMGLLPPPEDFSLTGVDGVLLKGKYFQKTDSAACAVILAHGWTSTWAGMLKYVPVLSDCHCDLVFYDHRAHGESGGIYATGGIKEAKDLLAVTSWVQQKKGFLDEQIGWLGASWGAATVLMAGADQKKVAFIIADAPFQNWYSAIFERAMRDYGTWVDWMSYGVMQMVNWRAGIDFTNASALEVASMIEEPVLLIHSQMDSSTDSEQSVHISEKLNSTTTIFHHLDWGGDHTQDVLLHTARFKGLVDVFLKKVDKRFLIQERE